MKRPELLIPVAAGLVAGSAHRQIARAVDEPIVFDHFETFEFTQDYRRGGRRAARARIRPTRGSGIGRCSPWICCIS